MSREEAVRQPFDREQWVCVGHRRLDDISLSRSFANFHVSEMKIYYDRFEEREWDLFWRFVWEIVLYPQLVEAAATLHDPKFRFGMAFIQTAFSLTFEFDGDDMRYSDVVSDKGGTPQAMKTDDRVKIAARFMKRLCEKFKNCGKGFQVQECKSTRYQPLSIDICRFTLLISRDHVSALPEEDNSSRSSPRN